LRYGFIEAFREHSSATMNKHKFHPQGQVGGKRKTENGKRKKEKGKRKKEKGKRKKEKGK